MANPSTVNPTASGKEVLRRAFVDGAAESETVLLTCPTDHICTLISIIIGEREQLSDAKFHLFVKPDGGANLFFLLEQSVPSGTAFVWSDKFVITGGDILKIEGMSAAGTAGFDCWISYIDQDWT